jgi:hypothetical protein
VRRVPAHALALRRKEHSAALQRPWRRRQRLPTRCFDAPMGGFCQVAFSGRMGFSRHAPASFSDRKGLGLVCRSIGPPRRSFSGAAAIEGRTRARAVQTPPSIRVPLLLLQDEHALSGNTGRASIALGDRAPVPLGYGALWSARRASGTVRSRALWAPDRTARLEFVRAHHNAVQNSDRPADSHFAANRDSQEPQLSLPNQPALLGVRPRKASPADHALPRRRLRSAWSWSRPFRHSTG